MKKNILLLAVAMITAFAIAEMTVRIFYPQPESIKWFKSDARYGYVNKKNFHQKYYYPSGTVMDVKTNSFGHRAGEYDLTKRKIMLIGDSFTFGYGCSAEDIFASRINPEWTAINCGVGGWGTLQEITYAKDNFHVFNPDIIIITFCGNDPLNDIEHINKLSDFEKGLFYFPGKIFLRDNSHLYRFLVTKNYMIWWSWVINKKVSETRKRGEDISIDNQSASVIGPAEWSRTFREIRQFRDDFIKFNPKGIVVIQAAAPTNTDIRSHLRTLDNGNDLIYMDLYEDFIKVRPEDLAVSKVDNHWSGTAHAISAKRINELIGSHFKK